MPSKDSHKVNSEAAQGEHEQPSSGTVTQSFGTGARESHDASAFYSRFVSPELSKDDTVISPEARPAQDQTRHGTAEELLKDERFIKDCSVALVVTSPPYFVGKDYEADIAKGHIPRGYEEHLANMKEIFRLCVNKLEPGGRICINVANLGRKPYRSQSADIIAILEELKLLIRGEIIWRKGEGMNSSTAWGSFQRPSNPVLRDLTERVIVASKGRFDRALSQRVRQERGLPHISSLFKEEFMAATKDVWDLPAESAKRIGHPAPFPLALPKRLIELYTYRSDLILDPYMGSGTTAVAAVATGRNFVGIEAHAPYVQLAEDRVEKQRQELAAAEPLPQVCVLPRSRSKEITPPTPNPVSTTAFDAVTAELRAGNKAQDVAEALLVASGFNIISRDKKLASGVTVDIVAEARNGRRFHFNIVGTFSAERDGLTKTDSALRAVGRAALIRHDKAGYLDGDPVPLIIFSTSIPSSGPAAQGIKTAQLSELILDVIDIFDPEALTRLEQHNT